MAKFDEINMLIINGDSKAEVKRIAGFENKMKDECVEDDSTEENPNFYKIPTIVLKYLDQNTRCTVPSK